MIVDLLEVVGMVASYADLGLNVLKWFYGFVWNKIFFIKSNTYATITS